MTNISKSKRRRMPLQQIANALQIVSRARAQPPLEGPKADRIERLRALLADCVGAVFCANGSVWIMAGAGGEMRCLVGLQGEERRLGAFRLRAGEGIAGCAARMRQPIAVEEVTNHPKYASRADRLLKHRTRELLSCPLIHRGEILGAVNYLNRISGRPHQFADGDVLVGQLLATCIADFLVDENLTDRDRPGHTLVETFSGDEPDNIEPMALSPQMREILESIRSNRTKSLLLSGETGVGKDLCARWAHRVGAATRGEFVAVNCAAIHESLWESEIFGHRRGAFTGATQDKPGQIELANGGTLFLNEIAEMPPAIQAKLLTFLDTGEFRRVGETRTRRVRARVISATNRDLKTEIAAGRFRKDLFYRLAQVHLSIPPLRERRQDVVALIAFRLKTLSAQEQTTPPILSAQAKEALTQRAWEGNTRELNEVVDRAFQRCRSEGSDILRLDHFDTSAAEAPADDGSQRDVSSAGPLQDLMLALGRAMQVTAGSGRATDAAGSSWSERGGSADLLKNPHELRREMEKHRCASSRRWNISAAHRTLVESGRIRISRPLFARRVREMLGQD